MAILNTIIVIFIALFVLLIPAGLVTGIISIIKASDDKNKPKRLKYILLTILSFVGPVVGLFVLISVWGLVSILANSAQ